MSDFSPGLQRAIDAGVKASRAPYAGGSEGIRVSVETVALKAVEARYDPDVKGWAVDRLKELGMDGRDRVPPSVVIPAMFEVLKGVTIYVADAYGSEVIQSAATTLCLRPGLCIRGGDCDDLTVLVAGVFLALGYRVWLVKQRFRGAPQEHILVAIEDEDGRKIRCDPSSRMSAGHSVPADEEVFYDPMEMARSSGAAGGSAEIVTLGAIVEGLGRGGGGGHPHGGGGGHPHGGGGGHPHGAGPRRVGRGVHHRYSGGRWWGWQDGVWVIVTGDACGIWSEPLTSPSADLVAFARAALAQGGPVMQSYGDALYLFDTTGGLTIRQCVDGSPVTLGGVGLGEFVDDDQITALIITTNGVMDATDNGVGQCYAQGGMTAADIAMWRASYNAWRTDFFALNGDPSNQAIVSDKTGCLHHITPSIWANCLPYYTISTGWAPAKVALLGYQATAKTWQDRIKAQCPNYNPPPPPPTPAQQPSGPGQGGSDLADQIAMVAKVVGIAGLTLAGAYAIYKVVQVGGDVAESGAKVRALKAATASDNPVPRGRGLDVRCPSGSRVQSLIFPLAWGVGPARRWATAHGFRGRLVDRTPNTIRIRQELPAHFRRMRTIELGRSGVKAVVGWPTC